MAAGSPVLVVDDDRPFREAVATALEAHGFCVAEAADGVEALQRLHALPRPVLVLLDLIIPGLDGAGFRRAQMADGNVAAIPVVLCSGEIDLALQADRLGIRDFVRKPVELDRLLACVARHAGGNPSAVPTPERRTAGADGSAVSASPGSAPRDPAAPGRARRPA